MAKALPAPSPLFLSLSAPDIVDPGEEFTVYASVLPMTATDKSVTWEIGDGLTVVSRPTPMWC